MLRTAPLLHVSAKEVSTIILLEIQRMSLFVAQSVGSLRRSDTSVVGVKQTCRHRSNDAFDPKQTSSCSLLAG
jgi:hypothetical protein